MLALLGAILSDLSDQAHGALGSHCGTRWTRAVTCDPPRYFQQPPVLGVNTSPVLLTLGLLLPESGLLRSRAVPR